jgi:hypothetical protein
MPSGYGLPVLALATKAGGGQRPLHAAIAVGDTGIIAAR